MSTCITILRSGFGMDPQAPCHYVCGNIPQPPVVGVRIGAQPDQGHRRGHPQLNDEHSGRLVHLGMLHTVTRSPEPGTGPPTLEESGRTLAYS
jgi:hypothetical protein